MARLNQHNSPETGTLFSLTPDVRIVELGKADAGDWTDHIRVLKDLLTANQDMYPGIERWFTSKVVPGLKECLRVAYVAYEGEKPVASAVLKLGNNSKFCHLRIQDEFQDQDLGQIFFALMTLETRHKAREIHFTLPESLWCMRNAFFQSFGFSTAVKAPQQYRNGNTELLCSAPHSTVWSAVLDKLPKLMTKFLVGGYSLQSEIVMSVKPDYAERILSGVKRVEIRKKFSKRWLGSKVVLYASKPLGALVGEATISSIMYGQPAEILSRYGSDIGCSLSELDSYAQSSSKLCAIEFKDVRPYKESLPLDQISHLLHEELKPPQSYCHASAQRNSTWAKAVSVATLLHGRFGYSRLNRRLSLQGKV